MLNRERSAEKLARSSSVLSELPFSDDVLGLVGLSVAAGDGVGLGLLGAGGVASGGADELLALSLRSAGLGWVVVEWGVLGDAWVDLGGASAAWADVGPGVDVEETGSLELDVGVDSSVTELVVLLKIF